MAEHRSKGESLWLLLQRLGHQPSLGLAMGAPACDDDPALDGVLRAFEPRLLAVARERDAAPHLAAELWRHPPPRRELLLRNSGRFRSLVLCDLLLRSGAGDPAADEERARLALAGLEALDPELYWRPVIADVRARAWGLLADARRRGSDLAGAEEAFAAARRELRRGTGDPLERARIWVLIAKLRLAQERSEAALRLLSRATAVFRQLHEWQEKAGALLDAAEAWRQRGRPARAIPLLERAARRLDPAADPSLAARLQERLAEAFAATGRPLHAQAAAARARRFERLGAKAFAPGSDHA